MATQGSRVFQIARDLIAEMRAGGRIDYMLVKELERAMAKKATKKEVTFAITTDANAKDVRWFTEIGIQQTIAALSKCGHSAKVTRKPKVTDVGKR